MPVCMPNMRSRKGFEEEDREAEDVTVYKRSSSRLRQRKSVDYGEENDLDDLELSVEFRVPFAATRGKTLVNVGMSQKLPKSLEDCNAASSKFSAFEFVIPSGSSHSVVRQHGRHRPELIRPNAGVRFESAKDLEPRVKSYGKQEQLKCDKPASNLAESSDSISVQDCGVTLSNQSADVEKPSEQLTADHGGEHLSFEQMPLTETSESIRVYAELNKAWRLIATKVGRIQRIVTSDIVPGQGNIYLVKIENRSYRNLAWVEESTIREEQPQLLQGYLRKRCSEDVNDVEVKHPFPAEYTVIDRVIAEAGKGIKKKYYVKWRGLNYSEATWERPCELKMPGDMQAIERYRYFQSSDKSRKCQLSTQDVVSIGSRQLRDYQREGVAWMFRNVCRGVNCILADEMGLGKTIQSVALLETLRMKKDVHGPFLVIAPVTTLGHWQREVESLDSMDCVLYSGSQLDRDIIQEYEFWYTSRKAQPKFNVLLTSFEIFLRDKERLAKFKWKQCIVDEAHRLKSVSSKTSQALKTLEISQGGLLLLTGTPVQNNTKELFGLLNVLDSETFGSEDEFMFKFGDIRDPAQVKELQEQILRPRLLRRMKDDVEKSIPKKEEVIIWVELTKEQRLFYRAILEGKISVLLNGSKRNNIPQLRNVAMELRKLCNHPFLCDGLLDNMLSKKMESAKNEQMSLESEQVQAQLLRQSSGKMILLDKLLPKLKEGGHRVLIFSQFVMMLDLLEDYLTETGYSFERIDGSIRGSERQAAIDRYCAKDSKTFVFLISTKAGGLGITLTAADTCIIYDSDWNPQNDLQAMARCHRIGQTKDVKVYRLITSKTYEQQLFQSSSRKYGLDEAILGNHLGADRDPEQSQDIERLLRNGAYDLLKEGEEEAAAFSSANIDQILNQRTQTRVIGGSGNSTFSVATFDASDGNKQSEDNAQDAASFWRELLPTCESPKESEGELTAAFPISRKRSRVNYKEKHLDDSDEDCLEEGNENKYIGRQRRRTGNLISKDDSQNKYDVDMWTSSELKRLEEALFSIGEGRSEQIRKEADLEHRSMADVEEVSQSLIQVCLAMKAAFSPPALENGGLPAVHQTPSPNGMPRSAYANASATDTQQSEEALSKVHVQQELRNGTSLAALNDVKLPACVRAIMKTEKFQRRMKNNWSGYLSQLGERKVLADAVAAGLPQFKSQPIKRSKKPNWWDAVADRDLLLGAHRHGHLAFAKIRDDADLCFTAKLQRAEADRNKAEKIFSEVSIEQNIENNVEEESCVKENTQAYQWPADRQLKFLLKGLIAELRKGTSKEPCCKKASPVEAWLRNLKEDSCILDPLEQTIDEEKDMKAEICGNPPEEKISLYEAELKETSLITKTEKQLRTVIVLDSSPTQQSNPREAAESTQARPGESGSYRRLTEDSSGIGTSAMEDQKTCSDVLCGIVSPPKFTEDNSLTQRFQVESGHHGPIQALEGSSAMPADATQISTQKMPSFLKRQMAQHEMNPEATKAAEVTRLHSPAEKEGQLPSSMKRAATDVLPACQKRSKAPVLKQGSLTAFFVPKTPL